MKKLARFLLMMAGLAALPACASSEGMEAQRLLAATPVPQVERLATAPEHSGTVNTKHAVSVHFDSGSDEIRAGAMQTLYGAVLELKGSRIVAVRVIGHTDASGKRDFNQRLSERRAAAVAAQLVKLGLKAEVTVVRGAGEGSAKGKRKSRQDRRVDIEFETVAQSASLAPQADSITVKAPVVQSSTTLVTTADVTLPGVPADAAAPATEAPSPLALQRADKHAIKLTFLGIGTTWLPPPVT